ncbi:MAG: hypothetical protein IJ160_05420, partial [Muribaculaceae bacterium]|nr:hypothetical protein [Muribaculaceae bacterium]
ASTKGNVAYSPEADGTGVPSLPDGFGGNHSPNSSNHTKIHQIFFDGLWRFLMVVTPSLTPPLAGEG